MQGLTCTAEMARAYHEGRKTQTRRVVKPQPDSRHCRVDFEYKVLKESSMLAGCWHVNRTWKPKYKVGDVLYVQEPWGVGCRPHPIEGCVDGIEYQSDEFYLQDDIEDLPVHTPSITDDFDYGEYEGQGWQSAKTMPQWCARTFLEVTGIRVERVCDISYEDIKAEGIELAVPHMVNHIKNLRRFKSVWQSIYGIDSWVDSPWVFVYETKNVERPEL